MNKKLLAIFGILCVISLLTVPMVSAKPTSASHNAKAVSFMWHSENGGHLGEDVVKTNPAWAEGTDVIVTHTYANWQLNDDFSNYVQLGDDDPITIYAENYEGDLYVQTVSVTPGFGALNYRVYEKIMWGDDNYIEIMCLERASYEVVGIDPGTGEPIIAFYASGTFSGHGVIDGQKVQVTGIREGILGPTGITLECYGTIRGWQAM